MKRETTGRMEGWKIACTHPSILPCLPFSMDPVYGDSAMCAYPTPNNFPINPEPLIPAKTIRIAADTIAPSNIGHRVR